jgi:hypothetical protein
LRHANVPVVELPVQVGAEERHPPVRRVELREDQAAALVRVPVRERDDLRRTLARLEDFSYGQQLALNNADVNHNAVLFALSDEGGHNGNGWRPSRGLDVLVDLALDVREERDRLRAQRALDNEALARAWDEGRDRERAATVAYLRGLADDYGVCLDLSLAEQADIIERGEHRREGEP